MTCDQTQPLLEAFADGELGWGAGWRIRRHLAACPACAAEVAETRRLDSRVRAWRDVSAPAGLQGRLAAALVSAPSASLPRRPAVARRAAVGLAGVAAAAVAFFWLLPGQPGRPAPVMADVEQVMQQAQTVSYDFDTHWYDAQGRATPEMAFSNRNWLRRIPAASAQYDAIMHEWNLYDARGYVGYSQRLNNYLEKPPEEDIEQSVKKQMRRLTEPPTDAEKLLAGAQPWQWQETTIDGRSCVVFTQDADHNTRTTIWVDAQTLHIIRIELVSDPPLNVAPNLHKAVVMRMVIDNFHYNETPPPGVFDWSPPAGANVRGHW